jgi:hypothetical protein
MPFLDQAAPLRGARPGVSAAAQPWEARAAHAGPHPRRRRPSRAHLAHGAWQHAAGRSRRLSVPSAFRVGAFGLRRWGEVR